jgi:hypothetical protein
MALTQEQLPALKAYIESIPAWSALPMNSDSAFFIAGELKNPTIPAFVVYKPTEKTEKIGRTVSYVAIEALTATNLDKVNTFYRMNPTTFEPVKADVRSYWTNVLSGALGGAGQASRDAMDALYRRTANVGEKIYATGTGTTVSPGSLVFEGEITYPEVEQARNLP